MAEEPKTLIDQLAEEITAALMKKKREMTMRGESMFDRHVRQEVRAVLAVRIDGTRPVVAVEVSPEERIYAEYPRKIGKKKAIKAIEAALGEKPYRELLEATRSFAAAVAKWPASERLRFCPHPATWFNRGSYADDPKEWQRNIVQADNRDYQKPI